MSFKSAFRVLLCVIAVSVTTLASAQSFWEYSAQGSFFDRQGNASSISGSLFLDGTVRTWAEPNLPSVPGIGQNSFLISSFDLNMGDLDFFGGGPFSNPDNLNALYVPIPNNSGTFEYCCVEWFLAGSGDFTRWLGDSQFFNSDGTGASVEDIFQTPPALIHAGGSAICSDGQCGGVQMDFTRVAQVAPIPEPEIYAMLGVGLAMLGWVARRKKLNAMAKTSG